MNYPILVNVCIITYNQEKYIAQTIESVLSQRAAFSYLLVIGEDCSTDKTREICIAYKDKYPERIKLILHDKNIGANRNFIDTLNNCQGEYIALCEGDDYWTDPDKLQKQVDFLEANLDYGMVCTDFDAFFEHNSTMCESFGKRNKEEVLFEDFILDRSTIGTATVVIRKNILDEYLDEIKPLTKSWAVGDIPLWLYIAKKSRIRFMNFSSAVYRKRVNSACRYADIDKQYRFYIKGYHIPFYFINKYGGNERIKNQLYCDVNRMYMRYRLAAQNRNIGSKNYKILKKIKCLSVEDVIMYYGSFNGITKSLARVLLLLVRKIGKASRYIKRRLN